MQVLRVIEWKALSWRSEPLRTGAQESESLSSLSAVVMLHLLRVSSAFENQVVFWTTVRMKDSLEDFE